RPASGSPMVEPPTPIVRPLRRALIAVFSAVVAVSATGCGNAIYAVEVSSASNKVEEAHELGAEKLAPYEYFYAKEHLDKAAEEASEADYSDAINLAEASEEYANKAIRLSKEAERGAGR
ncbi:MAG: DUF4398 domain-containing protein, partial [Thermoanaerobaculia bacterium]